MNKLIISLALMLISSSPLLSQSFMNHNIASDVDSLRRIMPGDLDNDGDMDLVIAAAGATTGTLFCLENVSGSFYINDSVTIQNGYAGARGLSVGDIDNDGDMDVCLAGIYGSFFAWWANDGDPFDGLAFPDIDVILTSGSRIYNVDIADIDGTNNNDLIVPYAIGDDVAYFENDGSSIPSFTEHIVNNQTTDTVAFAVWANAADINNDGLLDMVATANDYINNLDGRITWFENSGVEPDGGSTAWSSTNISTSQEYPFVNCVYDIDRDGDKDILVGANDGDSTNTLTLVLYWNESNGASWSSTTDIDPDFNDAEYVSARDMDGDGYIDLLVCNDAGILRIHKNDGTNTFSLEDTIGISSSYYGARTIYPVDIDNDGDPDIVSVAFDADNIDWWENDAEDKQLVITGDSAYFWNDNLKIIVTSSSGGTDSVSVFYDSEQVPDTTQLGAGVNSILPEGFFTLTTEKNTFDMTLKFAYNNQPRWNTYTNENDLVILRWDGSQWIKAGTSQNLDVVNDTIVVNNVTELGKFALGEADYILANIKVFLEGPYSVDGDTMFTDLLDNEVIPLSQPYNIAPWNYSGGESVTQIPDDVVDWVLLELRTGTAAATAVSWRAGFLRNDGMIVDLDGLNQVHFSNMDEGQYNVVVYHRNHLVVMTSSTTMLSQSGSNLYDFTTGISQFYGGVAVELETGVYGMYGGDGNGDGFINATDQNLVWRPANGTSGYSGADLNMDGFINATDRNLVWRINNGIGTNVP